MEKKVIDELKNKVEEIEFGMFITVFKSGYTWIYVGSEEGTFTPPQAIKLLGLIRILEKEIIDKLNTVPRIVE